MASCLSQSGYNKNIYAILDIVPPEVAALFDIRILHRQDLACALQLQIVALWGILLCHFELDMCRDLHKYPDSHAKQIKCGLGVEGL